jgi:hypothetical protein
MRTIVFSSRLQKESFGSQSSELQAFNEVGYQIAWVIEWSVTTADESRLINAKGGQPLIFARASASDHIPRTPPF